MRQARLTLDGHHFQHTITRIVGREFILGDQEREYLWKLIECQSLFSGVRVVTAVIMSNHMHLLLEQIDRDTLCKLKPEELFEERLPHIYNDSKISSFQAEYENLIKLGDAPLGDNLAIQREIETINLAVFSSLPNQFVQKNTCQHLTRSAVQASSCS